MIEVSKIITGRVGSMPSKFDSGAFAGGSMCSCRPTVRQFAGAHSEGNLHGTREFLAKVRDFQNELVEQSREIRIMTIGIIAANGSIAVNEKGSRYS